MSGPFLGPLFKRLTQTDAGVGLAKVSGPTMLREIRDFLPRPTGRPRRVSVRAKLFDDGPKGRRSLGEASVVLQSQGGGGKAVEVYLSDLGEMRGLCDEGDLLLIEPSAEDADLLRVTRVAKSSPRFAATDARTGGRDAGLLSGGVLPRIWETGRLRPVTDAGEVLLADFSVEGAWPRFEVTFESKDGHGRNSHYEQGFELVLERLSALNATLIEARITSDRVMALAAGGEDTSFQPAGMVLPAGLQDQSASTLRRALVLAGSRIGVTATGNGNTTRRMTITVELAGGALTLLELEERLAGSEVAPPRETADPTMPQQTLSPPLSLVTDLEIVDAALAEWRDVLRSGSRPLTTALRWIDGEGFGFRCDASKRRPDAVDTRIGVRQTGAPWTVEINSPRIAADANGLSSIATDQNGRRVLVRQGRLQKNPDSDGEISGERFRSLSGLAPVAVTGESTPQPREWFVVADLEASPAQIRASTARFVHACAAARARSLGAMVPAAAPPLEAPGEKGGTYTLPATSGRPERQVQRIHGEVWQALAAALEPHGAKLAKLRHDRGYEVDGVIETPAGPLLVEIKSQASAADVYEGVGQLILYAEMMQLGECRRLLLLPFRPSEALLSALNACGILLETFEAGEDSGLLTISFTDKLLQLCGVAGNV